MKGLYIANSGYYRECQILNIRNKSATMTFPLSRTILYVPIEYLKEYNPKLKDKPHGYPKRKTRIKIEAEQQKKQQNKKPNSTNNSISNNHLPLNRKRSRDQSSTREYSYQTEPRKKRRRFNMASEAPNNLNEPSQENEDNKENGIELKDILKKIQMKKGELAKAGKATLMGIRAILDTEERSALIKSKVLTKDQLMIWVDLETSENARAHAQAERNRAEVAGMNERLNEAQRKLIEAQEQKERGAPTVKLIH